LPADARRVETGAAPEVDLVRNSPDRGSAVGEGANTEAVRLESSVQRFTRLATEDYEIEGQELPAGSRVVRVS